jgi:hypothetical protein
MGLGPKIFIRKNGNQKGGKLYKWSPDLSRKKGRKDQGLVGINQNYFCTTPLGSQGNDFKVTYTYVVVVVGGKQQKHAYVQCDYVK